MPSAESIVAALARIARDFWYVGLLWHIALAAAFCAVALGWRPSARTVGTLLVAPITSVSLFAWLYGNPFNGSVSLLLAAGLLVLARRLPRTPMRRAPKWMRAFGWLMLAFGWTYPHFLHPEFPLYAYLFAAPIGLVPCPTLSVVTGIALLTRGLESRAASLLLATAGLFYGIFGAVRLGVAIDFVLTLGAAALLAAAWKAKNEAAAPRPPALLKADAR
jgi:hypothetical protein